jgi:hypothetical protein
MDISRRQMSVVAAGAMTVAVVSQISGASANAADEAAVKARAEELREATFKADKAKLAELVDDALNYGHSSGVVQTKDVFINDVVNRKYVAKSLQWPDLKVVVSGNAASVRHRWESVNEENGKTTETKIGVVQVWQKYDGKWRLFTRQGFKLPA